MSKYILKQDNGFSSPSTYSIEGHEDLVNKYAGNSYVQEKLKANPYANFEGTQTVFGNLGDSTGLWRSSLSRNMEERALLYDQYNADVLADWENQQRNEPSTQKGLDIKAGLNPDLTGIQGSSAPADKLPSEGQPAKVDAINQTGVGDFFNAVGTVFSSALGIYNGFLSTSMNLFDMDMKALGNYETFDKMIDNYLGSTIKPAQDYDNWQKFVLHSINSISDVPSFYGLYIPKRFQKQLYGLLRNKVGSEKFYNNLVKSHNDLGKNIIEFGQTNASPFLGGYNLSGNKWFDQGNGSSYQGQDPLFTASSFASDIVDLEFKVRKELAEFQANEAKYKKDYYGNLNGQQHAQLDTDIKTENLEGLRLHNQGVRYDNNVKKVLDDINSSWRKIVNKIRIKADAGDKFSQAMLISLSIGNFALNKIGGFSSFANPMSGARSFGVNLQ